TGSETRRQPRLVLTIRSPVGERQGHGRRSRHPGAAAGDAKTNKEERRAEKVRVPHEPVGTPERQLAEFVPIPGCGESRQLAQSAKCAADDERCRSRLASE